MKKQKRPNTPRLTVAQWLSVGRLFIDLLRALQPYLWPAWVAWLWPAVKMSPLLLAS